MKRLLMISPMPVLMLASCATDTKDWDMQDPNESTMMAEDVMVPRGHRSDSIGSGRQAMTDREMRELMRKKDSGTNLSGELSVGVGTRF